MGIYLLHRMRLPCQSLPSSQWHINNIAKPHNSDIFFEKFNSISELLCKFVIR